jgi:hypothetical protein
MANRKKLTPARVERFLAYLAENANATLSASLIGVTRPPLYALRRVDMDFQLRWNQAYELGLDALEDEAARRALHGVEKPVWHNGKQVGTEIQYSDTLLMFLLNGGRPEKYRQRAGDVNVSVNAKAQAVAAVSITSDDANEAAHAYQQLMLGGTAKP